mmetsp:Transcript_25328/g.25069  ORF Transcript_25328/g.25069 Transcript_25328/m.25069 type:complete len:98 (-) Transcript_25328:56-349(-)
MKFGISRLNKIEKRKLFVGAWMRFAYLQFITKNIADKYNIHREREIRNLRTDWCLRRIWNQFKSRQKKKGRMLEERNNQRIRLALSFTIPSMKDTVQ